ncbi:hypothetical protein CROQUDRAFT_89389 [Cronartium quercuum f. sp. fusiforme G11]|uniref:Tubulin-specific chaperone D n=1 Tax=Cronartium quercuum f. sp. fusiforme G11 TaxID=708437 RepID=A0A9P6TEA4_9BASI|nr:hypothetical protein CROQUDRAFT_89389 [Cronartium quercuum f. sp. fusiforme G11]
MDSEGDPTLSTFAEEKELSDLVAQLVNQTDTSVEQETTDQSKSQIDPLIRLSNILDLYQEQPYLLDPHLEEIVLPVVSNFRKCIEYLQSNHSPPFNGILAEGYSETKTLKPPCDINGYIQRLAHFLYLLTKVRGYKTIVRLFPHEVQDLSLVLTTFSLSADRKPGAAKLIETLSWEFRYIMLLWLSLICMIPFDLSRFDQIPCNQEQSLKTSENIQINSSFFLSSAGKEREAAALVLARLMLRQDMASTFITPFLESILGRLNSQSPCDIFEVTGILQTLCYLTKLARPSQLQTVIPQLYRTLAIIDSLASTSQNITVRKLRVKLAGRIALLCLSAAHISLIGDGVSEEVEVIIQELLSSLQDKDTIVRWSGAKYLARLAKLLPIQFATQVFDAVLDLFEESQSATESTLLAVSEHTWHGACLASAEFLRWKIFPLSRLERLLKWTVQALHFEQRKGVRNIGSGVRDAAAYVLWSLGRAFRPSDLGPFGDRLAIQLVLQSLFDREVHIRRAGSAAFQENVGRLGVFPHGIQVLQIADFFTVGLRRSSFLTAAPEVAKYEVYQEPILNHLIGVCICHWDLDIRELASRSIGKIASHSMEKIPQQILGRIGSDVNSKDVNKVHGTLLTLAEIAKLFDYDKTLSCASTVREQIFVAITSVKETYLTAYSSNLLLIGICEGLMHTFSTDQPAGAEFPASPYWDQMMKIALKRPDDTLHTAIQRVFLKFSTLGSGLNHVPRLSKVLKSGQSVAKQAAARFLGGFILKAERNKALFDKTFELLLQYADREGPVAEVGIEVRRNAIESIVALLVNLDESLNDFVSPTKFLSVISVLINGLNDYTNDERGDVGSWVRSSSLKSLAVLVEFCTLLPNRVPQYLPKKETRRILAGILKQTVESIDSLRELAWSSASTIVSKVLTMEIDAYDCLATTFDPLSHSDLLDSRKKVGTCSANWRDLSWTFPRTLNVLKLSAEDESGSLTHYLDSMVEGIVLLVGGKGNSAARQAAQTLCTYLSTTNQNRLTREFVSRILQLTRTRTKEPKLLLSALETLAILLELPGTLAVLEVEPTDQKLLKNMLVMATHGLNRPNFPLTRVMVGMKIVIRLTAFVSTRSQAGQSVARYLAHHLPRVRGVAADMLANQPHLQIENMTEVIELLTTTNWTHGK